MQKLSEDVVIALGKSGFVHFTGLKYVSRNWQGSNFEMICPEMMISTKGKVKVLSYAGKHVEYQGTYYIYTLDGQVWIRMKSDTPPNESEHAQIQILIEDLCPKGKAEHPIVSPKEIEDLAKYASADIFNRKKDPYCDLEGELEAEPVSA